MSCRKVSFSCVFYVYFSIVLCFAPSSFYCFNGFFFGVLCDGAGCQRETIDIRLACGDLQCSHGLWSLCRSNSRWPTWSPTVGHCKSTHNSSMICLYDRHIINLWFTLYLCSFSLVSVQICCIFYHFSHTFHSFNGFSVTSWWVMQHVREKPLPYRGHCKSAHNFW